MLQTPLRLLLSLRPQVPLGILLGSAISTVVFTATPFLLPAVADEQGVSIGLVGIISTAQLGGFVVASWGAGRILRPSRRLLVVAALLGAAANIASAFTPLFALLVLARFVSGLAIGLVDWIAWSEVFGDERRIGDVAMIGPLIGTVAAPLIALSIDTTGSTWTFFGFAWLHLLPLAFLRSTHLETALRPRYERHRPTRAAVAVLVCLGAFTLGGSAVFVYAGAIGLRIDGMSALLVALAFSANALAGIPSARWRRRRSRTGLWVVATGVSAFAVGAFNVAPVFWLAMSIWGFAFWMAVPGAFALLAERSRFPEERAGDAQAVMAMGRVIGPLIGGALYSHTSTTALGIVGGGSVLAAGVLLLWVEHRSRPIASAPMWMRRARQQVSLPETVP